MTPRRLIEPARLAGTTMLRTQSDARLVDLVRAGHAAAFEAIVQRYRRQLLAYCSRLLPASRAEDAVQQTFLKAYQAMISGDAELNLRPWLYRIAHNASLNLLRQNGWSHEQLDERMDGVQRPEEAVELRERLRSTVHAVKALPERQRNAVLLREIEGLSYQEIALALGVGDGAVRQLLHRARATLQAGATAVTPVGVVERLTSALASGGDPVARVGELAVGAGGGLGAVKLGAAVLATGVIAGGAVTGMPLRHHARHGSSPAGEASAVPKGSGAASSGRGGPGAAAGVLVDDRSGRGGPGHGGDHGESRHSHRGRGGGHGSGSSGRSGDRHGSSSGGSDDSSSRGDLDRRDGSGGSGSGSRDGSGSGSRDGGGDRSSGSGSSGSGGSDSGSGSSGSGSSGSGSDDGSSQTLSGGGSGSGDVTTTSDGGGETLTAPTDTTDGSSGERSGSDGSVSGSTSGG